MGGRAATREDIHVVEIDCLLGHHTSTLLRIVIVFVEPVDNDVPIDKERQLWDSDIKSEEDNC